MTAHDSIGYIEKCLFGKFRSDVRGISIGRVSVFHAKVVVSDHDLVISFFC